MESLTVDSQKSSDRYVHCTIIDAMIYDHKFMNVYDMRDGGRVFIEYAMELQAIKTEGEFHYQTVQDNASEQNLKKSTNYLKSDMVFLPLNRGRHWYLGVVNPLLKEIHVLDSSPYG